MQERYFLKMKGTTLGEIIKEDGKFRFEIRKPSIDESNVDQLTGYFPPYFYPCEFYMLGEREFDYEVTHDDIYNFFYDRSMDKGRPGLDEFLYKLGLTEWEPWEICKKTKAHIFEDYFWITQDENEDYRNVLTRY